MVTRRVKLAVWWRRAGVGLRLLLFLIGAALFTLLVYLQRPQEESSQLGGGLLVFLLVNLNIVIICVLAFLVGRNVVKLIFDRKKKILGSRLRMRLVLAFVGLALVPTCLLFMLASGLLNRAMEGWFSSQVEASVTGAVEVARHHYDWLKDYAKRVTESVANDIGASDLSLTSKKQQLRSFLEERRQRYALFGLQVLKPDGQPQAAAQNAAAAIEPFSEPVPDKGGLAKAEGGTLHVLFEERGASQFIRAYAPLQKDGANAVLLVTVRVNPKLSHALSMVNDSYKEYEQLKFFKNPLKSGYLLTLAMITGLVLFSAIWIGFYMAREIAVPIQDLAEATRRVARGDYDFHIRSSGDDEITFLVNSFNRMTDDLKRSRTEVERHRVFIETILSNLAVGVVALDPEGRVDSVNPAAATLYDIQDVGAVLGKDLQQVLGEDRSTQIQPLLESIEQAKREGEIGAARGVEQEITISSGGQEHRVMCTAGSIVDERGKRIGIVLLFDDITELSKAQQMAAWREVARRIAHEIKNPLTPIQLSAQRLNNLITSGGQEGAIRECTQTIVEQVGSIKRLANEFSRFARMPTAEFQSASLNQLVSDVVMLFAENTPDVLFQCIADNSMPEVLMDREQIRGALLNLIDNAIYSVRECAKNRSGDFSPKITVKTNYSRRRKTALIEVGDNGMGIAKNDKPKIFDPYFTTKKGGTGLGLAIVTSTIADHQGEVRIYDNLPHGAKFVLEVPIMPSTVTLRRFARETAV